MELGLLTPATISFAGTDLGKFNKDTEVTLSIKEIKKDFTKTTSSHKDQRRVVRKECKLSFATKWSKEKLENFFSTVSALSPSGVVVIDNSDLNITIQNMSLSVDSNQSFGGNGDLSFELMCLDKFPNIIIIEK